MFNFHTCSDLSNPESCIFPPASVGTLPGVETQKALSGYGETLKRYVSSLPITLLYQLRNLLIKHQLKGWSSRSLTATLPHPNPSLHTACKLADGRLFTRKNTTDSFYIIPLEIDAKFGNE